jgi:hypothetical protein
MGGRLRPAFSNGWSGRFFMNRDQPVGFLIGQRPQQYDVDESENRGIGPDTERQRQHGDSGEAGVLGQHSQAVADVLK